MIFRQNRDYQKVTISDITEDDNLIPDFYKISNQLGLPQSIESFNCRWRIMYPHKQNYVRTWAHPLLRLSTITVMTQQESFWG